MTQRTKAGYRRPAAYLDGFARSQVTSGGQVFVLATFVVDFAARRLSYRRPLRTRAEVSPERSGQHKGNGRRRGGARPIQAGDRRLVDERGDHAADTGLGTADRMAIVADHHVNTVGQTAENLGPASRRRHWVELAGQQQRRDGGSGELSMLRRHLAARPLTARLHLLAQPVVTPEGIGHE